MKSFFKVKTVDEVLAIINEFEPLAGETVSLMQARSRVLADSISAGEDIPQFNRSTMDGFAVRAKDTFGASESLPGLFKVTGEILMGQEAALNIKSGCCVKIWTGGMLPEKADAVVMIEYAREVDESTVELARAVAPFENVIRAGEDVRRSDTLLDKGQRLRPQDLGLIAALGRPELLVIKTPKVAVISTGDEIVPVDAAPKMGQIRDINTYTLGAQIESCNCQPIYLGLVKDDLAAIKEAVALGMEKADVVILSGGSSVGVRDFTVDVFSSFAGSELLVHGVSVSPGKPTILARAGGKSLWGLPGHATSAMITFDIFLKPLLKKLSGENITENRYGQTVEAVLSRNVASVHGREDYVRVRLETAPDGHIQAIPVLGKSGLISTMVIADGLVKIGLNDEGMSEGTKVDVILFEN